MGFSLGGIVSGVVHSVEKAGDEVIHDAEKAGKAVANAVVDGAKATAKGVEAVGKGVQDAAHWVQNGINSGVDAFEHSAIGNNVVGHFLGGVVEGATGAVTGTVSLAGGVLDGNTEKSIGNFIQHPGQSLESFGKGIAAAWKHDPAAFLGQVTGGVAVAVAAPAAIGAIGGTAAEAGAVAESAGAGVEAASSAGVEAASSASAAARTAGSLPAGTTNLANRLAAMVAKRNVPAPAEAAGSTETSAAATVREASAQGASKYDDLAHMNGQYRGEDVPGNSIWKTSAVKYLCPEERAAFRLTIRDGKLYDAQGKLFDTTQGETIFSPDHAIFVMDRDGSLFASTSHSVGHFHHSSFLGGQDVASAGELRVVEGRLQEITSQSGHYRPTNEQLSQFVQELRSQGVDVSGVGYKGMGSAGSVPRVFPEAAQ